MATIPDPVIGNVVPCVTASLRSGGRTSGLGDLGRRSFGHSRTQVQPRTRGDSESWSRLVKNPPADCRVPPRCELQLRSSVARRARAGGVCSRCTIRIASGATYALWWREHAQRAMMLVILTDVVRYVALGVVIWVQNSGWHVLPPMPMCGGTSPA